MQSAYLIVNECAVVETKEIRKNRERRQETRRRKVKGEQRTNVCEVGKGGPCA